MSGSAGTTQAIAARSEALAGPSTRGTISTAASEAAADGSAAGVDSRFDASPTGGLPAAGKQATPQPRATPNAAKLRSKPRTPGRIPPSPDPPPCHASEGKPTA